MIRPSDESLAEDRKRINCSVNPWEVEGEKVSNSEQTGMISVAYCRFPKRHDWLPEKTVDA